MSARIAWMRALTPLGWVVSALVVVAVLALGLGGLGLRWDPFGLDRRRAEHAEQAAAAALSQAAARQAEAQAQSGQIVRLDAALTTVRSIDRVTQSSIQTARTAHDAVLPLPADRLDRLRAHDRQLCRLAPDLVGCATAPDTAGNGRPAL